jgi:hypothetical protein
MHYIAYSLLDILTAFQFNGLSGYANTYNCETFETME